MIMWGVGQLVRQLIQPKIVGDSIGVPALPTLFLLFIGYKMGSVVGMILAVPVGIIVANMYQAGFFDTTIASVRILIEGFNQFRKLEDVYKRQVPDVASISEVVSDSGTDVPVFEGESGAEELQPARRPADRIAAISREPNFFMGKSSYCLE